MLVGDESESVGWSKGSPAKVPKNATYSGGKPSKANSSSGFAATSAAQRSQKSDYGRPPPSNNFRVLAAGFALRIAVLVRGIWGQPHSSMGQLPPMLPQLPPEFKGQYWATPDAGMA